MTHRHARIQKIIFFIFTIDLLVSVIILNNSNNFHLGTKESPAISCQSISELNSMRSSPIIMDRTTENNNNACQVSHISQEHPVFLLPKLRNGILAFGFLVFSCGLSVRSYMTESELYRDLNYSDLILAVRIFSLCTDKGTDFMYHKDFH